MPQVSPAKDYCFTINNPSDYHIEALQSLDYRYLVYQVEVGEEQGTPHIQGFVQLSEKLRVTSIKAHFKNFYPPEDELEEDEEPHFGFWQKRRGTPSEAAHYCKKPVEDCHCKHCDGLVRFDVPFEDGNMSAGSATERLAEVSRVIKAKGLEHTIERFPDVYLQYQRGMEALARFYCGSTPRDFQTIVTVLWGESDHGKTRYALSSSMRTYVLPPPGRSQTDFFGDYRPDVHEVVVLDDFYGYWR